METLCSSDSDSVTGYVKVGDSIQPVFSKNNSASRVREWGYPLVRQTILRFAEEISSSLCLVDTNADVRPAAAQVLETFWLDPTPDEAKCWGSFPFEDGSVVKPIAVPYPWSSVFSALRTGSIPRPPTYWRAGSWVITPRPVKFLIKLCCRLRRAAGRLARLGLTAVQRALGFASQGNG
jgi:hypothetical protein